MLHLTRVRTDLAKNSFYYNGSVIFKQVIQRFLDRCHKYHFTSQTVSIFHLLEQQDKSAFKRAIDNHMLGAIIPKDKKLVHNLGRRRCHLPQIKTERYMKTFINRLIFKYNLVQHYSILYYYCILSCIFQHFFTVTQDMYFIL